MDLCLLNSGYSYDLCFDSVDSHFTIHNVICNHRI